MIYTVILAPFAKPLAKLMQGAGARVTHVAFGSKFSVLWLIFLPVLPHLIYRIFLDQIFPTTHDVVSDWANHAHSFTFLITGFVLAKDEAFWSAIARGRKALWVLAIVLGTGLTLTWNNWDAVVEAEIFLWPARFGRVFFIWIVIASLLASAQRYLNRPSRALSYMTEAIFPWYILHQTLTIMAGYWLTRQGLPVGVEFAGVCLATFSGCLFIHEIFIRRVNFIRTLFGLKLRKAHTALQMRGQVSQNETMLRPET